MKYSESYSIDLARKLKKIKLKNRLLYDITLSKINEVVANPEHYKSLSHDFKGYHRVHVMKSFVLIFRIEGNSVIFMDLDHHDKIYRRN